VCEMVNIIRGGEDDRLWSVPLTVEDRGSVWLNILERDRQNSQHAYAVRYLRNDGWIRQLRRTDTLDNILLLP
jgi:hypothetical protein